MSKYLRNTINENVTNEDKMEKQLSCIRDKGNNKIFISILCGVAGFIIKTVIDKKDN